MQMLKKIFKGNRKYYLELDELAESQPVQKVLGAAEKIGDFAQEKAAELAKSQPVQEAVKTAEKVVDAAPEKLQSTRTTETKPAKSKAAKNGKASKNGKALKTDKVAKNGKNAAKKTAEKQDKLVAAPKNSGASSDEPPFWVAAMYNNSSSNNDNANGSSSLEQTFATDNLMPIITKSRRRPGASLNQFKDMAKKAKTPRN